MPESMPDPTAAKLDAPASPLGTPQTAEQAASEALWNSLTPSQVEWFRQKAAESLNEPAVSDMCGNCGDFMLGGREPCPCGSEKCEAGIVCTGCARHVRAAVTRPVLGTCDVQGGEHFGEHLRRSGPFCCINWHAVTIGDAGAPSASRGEAGHARPVAPQEPTP